MNFTSSIFLTKLSLTPVKFIPMFFVYSSPLVKIFLNVPFSNPLIFCIILALLLWGMNFAESKSPINATPAPIPKVFLMLLFLVFSSCVLAPFSVKILKFLVSILGLPENAVLF